jgi:hypothetical protein
MPSNNELIKEAEGLAGKLETTVETADHDQATKAAQAKKAARNAGKQPKPTRPPFYVAPGKSLTSKKGILSGDTADEVKAEFLTGGKKALDAFVKSGHVLKG